MCGIVGIFGNITERELEMFEVMLSIDITRGKDSTGIFRVTKDNNVSIVKDTYFPLQLIRSKEYEKAVLNQRENIMCLVGHNRATTIGATTKNNAHPFRHRNITLAHNGTLKTDVANKKKRDFATDSEGICYGIAEKGIDKVWEELHGAASLAYWDETEHSLNLITNGDRPLYFANTTDNRLILFASETWMIRRVCEMYKVKLTKNNTVWKPGDHNLWSFFYDAEDGSVIETERELTPRRPFTNTHGSQSSFKNASTNNGKVTELYPDKEEHNLLEHTPWVNQRKSEKEKDEEEYKEQWDWLYSRPNMGEKEYRETYHHCYFCFDDIRDDFDTVTVIDEEIAVCEACAMTAAANHLDINQMKGL